MRKGNIALIGFMGTGKTTTGMILSEKLGYRFVDSDDEIQNKCGLLISEIFKTKGEDYFRYIEMQVIKELSNQDKSIIACGGGVVKSPENVSNLKKRGIIVCLTADKDIIYDRISGNDTRPLVAGKSREEVYNLIEERKQLYTAADIFIDTSYDSPLIVANRVMDTFRLYR
ncbi:shikimate kinase [Oxobacter pfennigii]|uniref:Shikimate kinase n=2 Tax=Oxobacter pfennigii TaxID=36849 RepID=A0A0N8NTI5_9CLOT|nr:shikimate kinase [Oxobacter pfennigii]